MKKVIKKIIPQSLLSAYHRLRAKKVEFEGLTPKETFTQIYESNFWGGDSLSGTGSDLDQTSHLVVELESLLSKMNFKTLLDLPCGDFKWMNKVDLGEVQYLGADIVHELIEQNLNRHKAENINFQVIDLITDSLPKSDLIINRDCLVHLSFENICRSINNIKSSGSEYLLTTTFTDRKKNEDINTGEWRTLNLEKPPFNFPKPILILDERCTEGDGAYSDKSLALWKITKLPDFN